MNIHFQGKSVLLSGGTSGIGAATARAFTQAGARVFINHLGQAEQAKAMQEQGLVQAAFELDVSDREAVCKMVDDINAQVGAVDILVNNAGISQPTPFLEISEANLDRTLAVNLKGAIFMSQAALPGMLEQNSGTIINIVSELGYLGRANFAAYTASKGALITLTRSLAQEFAPTIRVNGIAPGPVMTDMLRSELRCQADLEKEMDIPLQRVGTPEEIASSVLFLASEHARFYCGDIISPNGGSLMR